MKEIKNPEKEVSKGINLNEKDYLTSLLTTLKDMEKNYVIAMTEASNEHLYNVNKEVFLKLAEMGRKVYELMFQNGWYKLETAEKEKINTKYQALTKELSDLKN